MKRFSHPSYRALFWVAMTLAVISSISCYYIWSVARQSIGDPRYFDPHSLSALRDTSYPFEIEIYGYKYQGKTGDYIDDHILAYGAYEKDVLFFMRDYIHARNNPDAVFLDIGACEGQHSLFMSRHVKRVHAFEPFPPVADRFRKMIQLNGFTNIELHEVGLGDKESLVPFLAPEGGNMGNGSFFEARGREASGPKASFRVVPGDKWLEPLGVTSIELVKIDVEGYEGPVLAGLTSTLTRNRPVVVVEVSPPAYGTIKSMDMFNNLFPRDYQFSKFVDLRESSITGKYELVGLTRIPRGPAYDMIVAYPKEREKLIRRGL
jgi:FkbM family methyltransferase